MSIIVPGSQIRMALIIGDEKIAEIELQPGAFEQLSPATIGLWFNVWQAFINAYIAWKSKTLQDVSTS